MNHSFEVGDDVIVVDDARTGVLYGLNPSMKKFFRDKVVLEVTDVGTNNISCRPKGRPHETSWNFHYKDVRLAEGKQTTIESQMTELLEKNLNRIRPTLFCKLNPKNKPAEQNDLIYIEFDDEKEELYFSYAHASTITWRFEHTGHYEATKQKLIGHSYTVI